MAKPSKGRLERRMNGRPWPTTTHVRQRICYSLWSPSPSSLTYVRTFLLSRMLDITSGFRGRSIYRLLLNDRLVDSHEERKRGEVKALTAVVRVCLFCGHLLPATPEGWPCPSVFGERLSFDRRQTTRRPKRAPRRSFLRWIRSATLCPDGRIADLPFCFSVFLFARFSVDATRARACKWKLLTVEARDYLKLGNLSRFLDPASRRSIEQ